MNKHFLSALILCALAFTSCTENRLGVTATMSDLQGDSLATVWDEAMPLGNATVGELVWKKGDNLRLSLDHTDLWDLRELPCFEENPNFRYRWVQEKVKAGQLDSINMMYDGSYAEPGPSKIPCAALEFPIQSLGKVSNVHLYLNNALCDVTWQNGATLQTFVHATEPVGWFVFEGVEDPDFAPALMVPDYKKFTPEELKQVSGVLKLNYETGTLIQEPGSITYHQPGWGDYYFDVAVRWKRDGKTIRGVWCVTTSIGQENAVDKAEQALARGVSKDYKDHMSYWNAYWSASSVTLPDSILQRQYDNEMYKFASTSRENSRPISLQAVWTADEGTLPPWKGDYHNDLNTQLSYWPAYTGNHLSEGLAFINNNWDLREAYRNYARTFFETEGIHVPGVATLDGRQMGGWAQYSSSPTVAAWIGQHFYLHWKYSADDEFLRDRAYPFMKEVCQGLEGVMVTDSDGYRNLPTSTSPEMFENAPEAWFKTLTNFDNALMRSAFSSSAEMAAQLGETDEAAHWQQIYDELPPLAIEDGTICLTKGMHHHISHRHFSHLMSIYPLGLIDMSQGEEAQQVIRKSLEELDQLGPEMWTGYSFSWLGNLKARAFDGEGAAQALRIFAEHFCLPNTFHANGDQQNCGLYCFTYRPFTLEGNMAFASAIQEMLLQSHTGIIRVFPAIPADWQNVSFSQLRARGAFLVSAEMRDGKVVSLSVQSEKGGPMDILVPGEDAPRHFDTKAGECITLL